MDYIQRFMNNWNEFSGRKRLAIMLFFGAVTLGLAMMSWYLLVPEYVPLFANLDPEQAHSITEALRRDNLPYKLAAAGTTITVPKTQVHEIRIQVAGEGLYNTGVGFELFDGVRLGVTDFERRLNHQRALQEELRRTIVQFSLIEQARVHLVIPEPSLFQRGNQLPTASVALKVSPLHQIDPEMVKSVVFLVSMSVPNLPPENVTVIDMSGRILSDKLSIGQDISVGLSSSQMDLKRQFEMEMENRLLDMLERIFGPGRVVAMIAADLNFDHNTVTMITFDSENTVLRSEHVSRERVAGSDGVGGVPGTGSNIPVYPEDGADDEYVYQRDEHTKNWEVGSSQSTYVTAPGRVMRLSASVTVSANLAPDQKAEIETLVAGAMGIDLDRGDKVAISGISFSTDHLDDITADIGYIQRREMIQQYLSYGIMGLAIILAFVLILVMGSKLLSPSATGNYQPTLLDMAASKQQAAAASEDTSEMGAIRNLVNNKPDEVAEIIRAWAYED